MARDTERVDTSPPGDEVSLFELGTSLLRHRWAIIRWITAGAVIALAVVLLGKPSYTATASFIPQASDEGGRSGLASLAGQFGISLGAGQTAANSPDFYADLLKSRVILAQIVADTFTVAGAGAEPKTLLDLLDIKGATPARRVELGVVKLRSLEQTTISLKTGVVQLSVNTPWPSLSFGIVQRLVASVNTFNLQTRQNQASEERRFTETRLSDARAALRASEDKLQAFLQGNRQFSTPELRFDQERLERDVTLNQQIVTSLAQAYEEVRIREVRNTPVITVIEPPNVPSVPDPRHAATRLIAGILAGGIIGVVIAFIQDLSRRRRLVGDPEAATFFSALDDVRDDAARLIPGRRKT